MHEPKLLVHMLRDRTSMYVNPANYHTVTAYLFGYDHATNGGSLQGFREWLIVRANGCSDLVWSAIILCIAFPGAEDPIAAVDESDLSDRHAIETLATLFDEFQEDLGRHGLRGIFHSYEKWLVGQEWYDESSPDFLP